LLQARRNDDSVTDNDDPLQVSFLSRTVRTGLTKPREKMKVPANVVDQLVEGAQADIRQVLNMLSTWRLSSDTMGFDDSKAL
jgi:replication-associated recombination protein RarA